MLCVTWFLSVHLNQDNDEEEYILNVLLIHSNKEPALYNTIGQTKKGGTKLWHQRSAPDVGTLVKLCSGGVTFTTKLEKR